MANEFPNESSEKAQHKSHGCLIAILTLIVICGFLFIVLYFTIINPVSKKGTATSDISGSGQYYDDETNGDYNIFKSAPQISGEQRIDGVDISVYCTDNYDLVEVKITIYDENDTVLDTQTLQGRNFSKGNTYKLAYRPSLSTMWNADHYIVTVTKYE